MRKIFTLFTALATALTINATTVTWQATDLVDVANGDVINNLNVKVNDNISFSLSKGESDKNCTFRKNSTYPAMIILYSKNSITFTANDATIESIKFIVNTTAGSATPGWSLQDDAKNTYTASADTWTGSVSSIIFTDKSAAQITGIEITYSADGQPDTPDPTPGDFTTAKLVFNENQVATGEEARHLTLSDNGAEIVFTSDSNNAQVDKSNGFFGTTEDYITLQYRYRPGGKSSKGVESVNKGVITLPCDGTLYIYAFNNQSDDRAIQIIQDNATVFDHSYRADDYAEVPTSSSVRKIYPVYSVALKKGTSYFLWPDNQLMLFGFRFEPKQISTAIDEIHTDSPLPDDLPAYDLMGRRVNENYKGIVIVGGKKYLRR